MMDAANQPQPGRSGPLARPVLLVGDDCAAVSRLADALADAGHRVRRARGEEAPRLLQEQPFQLVVACCTDASTRWLDLLVGRLRAPAGPNHSAALMLLVGDPATPPHPGANRVLPDSTPTEVLLATARRLLDAQSARNARHRVRLEVALEHAGGPARGTTRDLSASGLLIETAAPLAVGARFRFRLHLSQRAVSGEAKVVRLSSSPSTGDAVGARFCTFDGDGREHLGRFLDELRRGAAPASVRPSRSSR